MEPTTTTSMAAEIISTIITAITSFLTGIGSAIVDFFDATVVTEAGKLTNFATWALVFLGVSFGLGVVTAVLRKVG